MKGLEELAVIAGGRGSPDARIAEQGPAPIQGVFPVVALEWLDITSSTVEGGDPDALAGDGAMLAFLQVGMLVRADEERVVVMHSLSLSPNRSEFFTFPRGAVRGIRVVGWIRIDGDSFQVIPLDGGQDPVLGA